MQNPWSEDYKVIERLLVGGSSCSDAAHKFFGESNTSKIQQSYNYFVKDGVAIFVKHISFEIYSVDVLEPVFNNGEKLGLNHHTSAHMSNAKRLIQRIKSKPKHVFGGKICTK